MRQKDNPSAFFVVLAPSRVLVWEEGGAPPPLPDRPTIRMFLRAVVERVGLWMCGSIPFTGASRYIGKRF